MTVSRSAFGRVESAGVHPAWTLLSGPPGPAELMTAGRAVFASVQLIAGEHQDVPRQPAPDLRLLDGQLAVFAGLVGEQLAKSAPRMVPARVAYLSETLSDLHIVRCSIHEYLSSQRLQRLDALDRGLSALWSIEEQDELLDAACEAAVECCGFDRVLLSQISDNVWRPWRSAARRAGEARQRLLEWVQECPEIRLADGLLVEADVVRRGEPDLVSDASTSARVHDRLASEPSVTSYVVAPIVCGERVIGLLHADFYDAEVTELDREVLGSFARGFGRIFERAVLLSRLKDQRTEVIAVVRSAERVLDSFAGRDAVLRGRADTCLTGDEVQPRETSRIGSFDGVLTSRELEVLALMSTGATNGRIAEQLVIATETVKTHVKRVLRKLGAANRAEAVAMYLRLSIDRDNAPGTATRP